MTGEPTPIAARYRRGRWRTAWITIHAVLTRELRWRMRGRRAFVVATVFVLLLGLIVFGIYQLLYQSALDEARWRFGDPLEATAIVSDAISGRVSVRIGQAIFGGLLAVLTLLILMVAPALTSGVVSSEREKQTMELLVTSPISTLGMLIAKLFGALAYVLLLIVASVPLMAIVFAFGGVSPEDVVRAYVMVLAIAFGMGAVGLFLSAVIGRTQIATVVSYVVVFVLIVGTIALHTWMYATSVPDDPRGNAPLERRHAPEALLWLNPVVADVDLVCTAVPDATGFCGYTAVVTGLPEEPATPPRDAFWPKSALAFVILGCTLTLLATQWVSHSRRYRVRRRRRASLVDGPGPDTSPIR